MFLPLDVLKEVKSKFVRLAQFVNIPPKTSTFFVSKKLKFIFFKDLQL